ncbi:MFS transporter [Burkholderia anthina]|nr:MFS transporter [Burkholderia anthina]
MAFLVLRAKIPESPRWLLISGKRAEASRIVTKHFGQNADFEQLVRDTPAVAPRRGLGLSSIIELFNRGYGGAFVLCATFWTCQVVPSFAIKTFQPVLLKSFGITQTLMGSVLITSFAVVGTALGMLYINRIGRRPLILVTFIISSVALALLATPVAAITYIAIAGFILFTVSEAAGSALQYVYPNELFPTDLRATGMGISLAVSRIGAAIGTFFFPLLMKSVGPANSILIAAGLSVVGLCVCYAMAPETTGRALDASPEEIGPGLSDTTSELRSRF